MVVPRGWRLPHPTPPPERTVTVKREVGIVTSRTAEGAAGSAEAVGAPASREGWGRLPLGRGPGALPALCCTDAFFTVVKDCLSYR